MFGALQTNSRAVRADADCLEPNPSIVCWDGGSAIALIAQIEARMAIDVRFAVLASRSPLGGAQDRPLLEGWWRTAQLKLHGRCAGWAVLIRGADVHPELLRRDGLPGGWAAFPVRACPDRAEAIRWLRAQLTQRPTLCLA